MVPNTRICSLLRPSPRFLVSKQPGGLAYPRQVELKRRHTPFEYPRTDTRKKRVAVARGSYTEVITPQGNHFPVAARTPPVWNWTTFQGIVSNDTRHSFTLGSLLSGPVAETFMKDILPDLIKYGVAAFGAICGAYAYRSWYEWNARRKMTRAFKAGNEPHLNLANLAKEREQGLAAEGLKVTGYNGLDFGREEQEKVDKIISGEISGPYFVIVGPKGTGKTRMLVDAMRKTKAEGVSMCEAHPDLDVFRLRLGETLKYKYFEDSLIGAFRQRDPENTNPALSIERALSMLRDVAVKFQKKHGRPLVLIINNVQFFENDDNGRNILLQLQQRAEEWAPSGVLTMILCSDDIWPVLLTHHNASFMEIINVTDLSQERASYALRYLRAKHLRTITTAKEEPDELYSQVVDIVGGRLSHLQNIARQPDMLEYATKMLHTEKSWLLSQIGLLPDPGEEMLEKSQRSMNSWILLREFVKKFRAQQREVEQVFVSGARDAISMPQLSYFECYRMIRNPKYLEELDRANIIAMNINQDVTPHSLLVLRAASEIVERKEFEQRFNDVQRRMAEREKPLISA